MRTQVKQYLKGVVFCANEDGKLGKSVPRPVTAPEIETLNRNGGGTFSCMYPHGQARVVGFDHDLLGNLVKAQIKERDLKKAKEARLVKEAKEAANARRTKELRDSLTSLNRESRAFRNTPKITVNCSQ